MGKYKDLEINLVDKEQIENCICEDVISGEINDLIELGEKMIPFCVKNGGLGLAACQIGIYKKMFVWMNGLNSFQIIFNPKYFSDENKITNVIEGCLSYPNEQYFLKRYKYIRAAFELPDPKDKTNLKKFYRQLSGERAFIFAHETDHCNGITIAMKGELFKIAKT